MEKPSKIQPLHLVRLWAALNQLVVRRLIGRDAEDFIRLLILIGCSIEQLRLLEWFYVDLKSKFIRVVDPIARRHSERIATNLDRIEDRFLAIEASFRLSRLAWEKYELPPTAIAIFRLRRKTLGRRRFVFPAPTAGGVITQPKRAWRLVCDVAGLSGLQMRSLRMSDDLDDPSDSVAFDVFIKIVESGDPRYAVDLVRRDCEIRGYRPVHSH